MIRRLIGAGKALLMDENGQTMLEYIVIVVFVVIAAIVAFRLISGAVKKNVSKINASFDQG
jgi:Flp pilus assembly pilin Flp